MTLLIKAKRDDPSPTPPETGRALVDRAKYEDISRRVIMGAKMADIAIDIGYTERHLRRILQRPAFVEVYERISKNINNNLDEVVVDEKLQPLHRIHAMTNRSITTLFEVQEEVRLRIKDGTARATDLKVGADTAFGIIDRSKGELSPHGVNRVAVQFNINADKKALLRSVVKESGVDLSDLGIIDVTPMEDDPNAESPQEQETEAHQASPRGGGSQDRPRCGNPLSKGQGEGQAQEEEEGSIPVTGD